MFTPARAISSVGRAPALQAGSHWFKSGIAQKIIPYDFWNYEKVAKGRNGGKELRCLEWCHELLPF